MSALSIHPARPEDRTTIRAVEEAAFGQPDEAVLVERLVGDGDVVLELVAWAADRLVGHVVFSRLWVHAPDGARFAAVSLAPIAVDPRFQRAGIGSALVAEGHRRLEAAGERLCVVLGDPAWYVRFGYDHARAAGFGSDYQCEALQAIGWGEAPTTGRLVYPPAFGAL